MARKDRRKKRGGGGIGRDEWFRITHTPGAFERHLAAIEGANLTAKRGSEAKGGQKRGSWGPQGD